MAPEKLTHETVVEQALKLADQEGLEALTIRRLARGLGVTPMALYWHFKNKDELLVAVADHVLANVTADLQPEQTWKEQLRAMVEAVIRVMRDHPCTSDLLPLVHKHTVDSFKRATNAALDILVTAGFSVQDGYLISSYLLNGVGVLISNQPEGDPRLSEDERAEMRRRMKLELECLPIDIYPRVVEYGASMPESPDIEHYFTFGTDLLLGAVEHMAAKNNQR